MPGTRLLCPSAAMANAAPPAVAHRASVTPMAVAPRLVVKNADRVLKSDMSPLPLTETLKWHRNIFVVIQLRDGSDSWSGCRSLITHARDLRTYRTTPRR
ncbi:hypothetical protein GCM10010359_45810 [Streptomyces morookaense]|nr:hypothetical protein GCM10010359_45810 [Streptomyces morookaense]